MLFFDNINFNELRSNLKKFTENLLCAISLPLFRQIWENAVLKLISERVGELQYFDLCAKVDGTISSKPIDLSCGVRGLVRSEFFTLAKNGKDYFAFSENTISILPRIKRIRAELNAVKFGFFEFIAMPSIDGQMTLAPHASFPLKCSVLKDEIAFITIVGTFPLNFRMAIFSLRASFSDVELINIRNSWYAAAAKHCHTNTCLTNRRNVQSNQ